MLKNAPNLFYCMYYLHAMAIAVKCRIKKQKKILFFKNRISFGFSSQKKKSFTFELLNFKAFSF